MREPSTFGDVLMLYALSCTFQRHTVVFTKLRCWSTIGTDNPISSDRLLDICHIKLVYLGKDMYAELRRKPFNKSGKNMVVAALKYNVGSDESIPEALNMCTTDSGRDIVGINQLPSDGQIKLSDSIDTIPAITSPPTTLENSTLPQQTSDCDEVQNTAPTPSVINIHLSETPTDPSGSNQPITNDINTDVNSGESTNGINAKTDVNNMNGVNSIQKSVVDIENNTNGLNTPIVDRGPVSTIGLNNDQNTELNLTGLNENLEASTTKEVNGADNSLTVPSATITSMIGLNDIDMNGLNEGSDINPVVNVPNISSSSSLSSSEGIDWTIRPEEVNAALNRQPSNVSLANSPPANRSEPLIQNPVSHLNDIITKDAHKRTCKVSLVKMTSRQITIMSEHWKKHRSLLKFRGHWQFQ